jgi:hypothetical protein
MFRALAQVKYYFDMPIRPHLIAGTGMYWRTDTLTSFGNADSASQRQSALGLNAGFGLEIPLSQTNAVIQLEGIGHSVAFGDDNDTKFLDAGIPDRTGYWLVAQASLMITF